MTAWVPWVYRLALVPVTVISAMVACDPIATTSAECVELWNSSSHRPSLPASANAVWIDGAVQHDDLGYASCHLSWGDENRTRCGTVWTPVPGEFDPWQPSGTSHCSDPTWAPNAELLGDGRVRLLVD